jgi:hypothetical protein
MLRSHAPVTCSGHMLRSHAPVTCSGHMLRSHAPVTCSGHVLGLHTAGTSWGHLLRAHPAGAFCTHSLYVVTLKQKSKKTAVTQQWGARRARAFVKVGAVGYRSYRGWNL